MKVFLRDVLTTLIIAVVLFFGLRLAIEHSVVVSQSMEPSLLVDQHLIINKIVYYLHDPERGDVIVFHSTKNNGDDLIKRIIGLPGETVEVRAGKVYIRTTDGEMVSLQEPYIEQLTRGSFIGDRIPENEYFVMGDNRNNSSDSRRGWTVPSQNIVGKAWLSIWKPARWGLAPNYPLQEQVDSQAGSE